MLAPCATTSLNGLNNQNILSNCTCWTYSSPLIYQDSPTTVLMGQSHTLVFIIFLLVLSKLKTCLRFPGFHFLSTNHVEKVTTTRFFTYLTMFDIYTIYKISLMLYSAHCRIVWGNLVLRHSVPYFSKSSLGIAFGIEWRNSTQRFSSRPERAMKI